jgi:hypothetical protein
MAPKAEKKQEQEQLKHRDLARMAFAMNDSSVGSTVVTSDNRKFFYALKRNRDKIMPLITAREDLLKPYLEAKGKLDSSAKDYHKKMAELDKEHEDLLKANQDMLNEPIDEDIQFFMVDEKCVPDLPWGVLETLMPFISIKE